MPTYNESENILKLIDTIQKNIPSYIITEIIIVDDNSPDGTGKLVDNYIHARKNVLQVSNMELGENQVLVKIIHRKQRNGLISAILDGVKSAKSENLLVMDADFSHPPEIIPSMVKELMLDPDCDLVVASRYVEGGSISGWPFRRRVFSSGATQIARYGLKIKNVRDPMSGFFLCRRQVIEKVTFDTGGYKILLEMLVKTRDIRIKEIPYSFIDRKSGESKLDASVMIDYLKAVWRLYRYGRKSERVVALEEKRESVLFLSKAARFYSVGATGLLVNYVVSFVLSNGILANLFYLYATTIGIACSISSNFFLNKTWTFEDKNFEFKHVTKQYLLYAGLSAIGAALQLSLLYVFVHDYKIQYPISLIFAVAIASIVNFLLNKKLTFGEKIWG